MTKLHTHYGNLKVARDAPDFVIRAAYKTLSQKYHPDKNPDDPRTAQIMAAINQSYGVLSDPVRRKEHDAWIAAMEAQAAVQQVRPEPARTSPSSGTLTSSNGQSHGNSTIRNELKRRFLYFLISPPGVMGAILVVLAVFGSISKLVSPSAPPPPGPKPYQAVAPTRSAPIPDLPAYVRPETAPNGNPWPGTAGYVKGYPIDNDSGYSKITIDNSQNGSDVYAKLVSLDGATAYPMRQFYCPAGFRFTMDKVTAGKYDLRYRDLDTGGLSRSDAFDVEETRTAAGIEYSEHTITLYRVQGGNFQTYGLADDEF